MLQELSNELISLGGGGGGGGMIIINDNYNDVVCDFH